MKDKPNHCGERTRKNVPPTQNVMHKGVYRIMSENENKQDEITPICFFFNGFMLRLIYGLSGIGIMAILRPKIIAEEYQAVIVASLAYLFVCILGGIYDMNTKQFTHIPGLEKPRLIDIALFILIFIFVFIIFR